MTHNELAARIERAEGPDRALDAEIALAAGWREYQPGWFRPPSVDVNHHASELPRYTGSLDAAMQLVPEGFDWLIRKDVEERTAFANVSALDANNRCDTWDAELGAFVSNSKGHNYANAATPALALCAAALRARSAS